jgi:hypothetical protein
MIVKQLNNDNVVVLSLFEFFLIAVFDSRRLRRPSSYLRLVLKWRQEVFFLFNIVMYIFCIFSCLEIITSKKLNKDGFKKTIKQTQTSTPLTSFIQYYRKEKLSASIDNDITF